MTYWAGDVRHGHDGKGMRYTVGWAYQDPEVDRVDYRIELRFEGAARDFWISKCMADDWIAVQRDMDNPTPPELMFLHVRMTFAALAERLKTWHFVKSVIAEKKRELLTFAGDPHPEITDGELPRRILLNDYEGPPRFFAIVEPRCPTPQS